MSGIKLYCGLSSRSWNGLAPKTGDFCCISPVYGSKVGARRMTSVCPPKSAQIIQDSGAFSDAPQERLSFEEALERQIAHSHRYGYDNQVTHRASYDLLIDEIWTNGNRHKRRWSVGEASEAVAITIDAARWMKDNYAGNCILSAQGVDAFQYRANNKA